MNIRDAENDIIQWLQNIITEKRESLISEALEKGTLNAKNGT